MADDVTLRECEEEWRQVSGFEGRYDVSSLGRVRCWYAGGGYKRISPRIKVLAYGRDGYRMVSLYDGDRSRVVHIARLVLETFVGPAQSGYEASHLDGDKDNNHLSNLAWETRKENEERKVRHGRSAYGERNHSAKLSEREILDVRRKREQGAMLQTLAKEYGMSESGISGICRRVTWKHI